MICRHLLCIAVAIFSPSTLFSQSTASNQLHSAQVGDVNYSQEITAKASCDKSEYLVGDYIAYTIQVDYDKSLTILQPIMSDSLKNISIIRKGGPIVEEGDKNATVTYKYILSGYDSTGVLIPPTAVPYHTPGDTTIHYAATNSVNFTIRTLPVNLKKDIQKRQVSVKNSAGLEMDSAVGSGRVNRRRNHFIASPEI